MRKGELTQLTTGNVVFDFMTSDTKGDSTSTAAQELMLWLRYEGGQIPIGYNSGPVSKIDGLYGKSWTLYQGVNKDTGITVSSLLVDEANQYVPTALKTTYFYFDWKQILRLV